MKKQTNKNPYAGKHRKKQRRITRKQLIAALCVLGVAALLVGIICVSRIPLMQNGHDHDHDHDHGTTTTHGHSHDHGSASAKKINYRVYTNEDKTYRVAVTDRNNNVVFERDGLTSYPQEELMKGDIYGLGWATGQGPHEFEYVYCNAATGVVSQLFKAPRGCDGVRVAYPNEDESAIIVQDIFDKEVYYKEYSLHHAYTGGDYTVVGGKMQEDGLHVLVTYLVNENGGTTKMVIPLYEAQ